MVFQRTIIIFEIIVEGVSTRNLDAVLFRISVNRIWNTVTYGMKLTVCERSFHVKRKWSSSCFNIFTSNEF